MEQTGIFASKIAFAVMLFIFSPICIVFLAGLSEAGMIRENLAAGIGILVLLLLVAAGVAIIIINSVSYSKYDYLEKEYFVTDYGVDGIVQKGKEAFMPAFTRNLAIGVVLCILSVIPVIVVSILEVEEWVSASVALLLWIVGLGVKQIVSVGILYGGYQKLLQEGDYAHDEKEFLQRTKYLSPVYWCAITAVYLLISFRQNNWHTSWVIWPVAGLLFAVLQGILHMVLKNNVK